MYEPITLQAWASQRPLLAKQLGGLEWIESHLLHGVQGLHDGSVQLGSEAPRFTKHPLYNDLLWELRAGTYSDTLSHMLERDLTALSTVQTFSPPRLTSDWKDVDNAWAKVGEIHALARLATAFGRRAGTNSTPTSRGGKPDFKIGKAFGDVKTLVPTRVERGIEELGSVLHEVCSSASPNLGHHLGYDADALNAAHFEGKQWKAKLQALRTDVSEGVARREYPFDVELPLGPGVSVRIQLEMGMSTSLSKGYVSNRPDLKLKHAILRSRTQLDPHSPNIRILVFVARTKELVDHLAAVLQGTVIHENGRPVRVPGLFRWPTAVRTEKAQGDPRLVSGLLVTGLPIPGSSWPASFWMNPKAKRAVPATVRRSFERVADVRYPVQRRFYAPNQWERLHNQKSTAVGASEP